MSYGSSTEGEEETADSSEPQPRNHNVSVMREFLESNDTFEWPENLGKSPENHCHISGRIPLRWIKCISDKKASIDMYEAGDEFSFRKPFVVKTIRDPNTQTAREMTANEVRNMKDLRHPHVSALLATFTYQARLSILIFPAACCDLHQFMKRMSKGFEKDRITSPSDNTNTFDSDTTHSRHPSGLNIVFGGKHKGNDPQGSHNEPWPLNISIKKHIDMLRGYFVCLSQALSYLHGSDVRHKDIKPENILIDESGSAVLTDFGISRRFPKYTPHATNDEPKFTRKYASPEIMKDRNTLRDDTSDVFSLGCVFLEMATLLLGKDLNNLSDHCATIINDSGREEAYHCNLGKVHSWIDYLRASHGLKPVQEQLLLKEISVQNVQPSPDNYLTAALIDIRQMLDEIPSNRPASRELWQKFQHISEIICRDCDPRRPADIWKPSAMQQRDAQTGLNNRRSLHAIEAPPTLQLNGDTREGARALRSSSLIQRTETVSEEINPEIPQPSANTSPANVIHDTFTDVGHQIPINVGSTRSPQKNSRPQATVLDLSAIRQIQQLRESAQRRAIREDQFAEEPKKRTPPPQMPIIVYDVSQTIAYETVFASLKGA